MLVRKSILAALLAASAAIAASGSVRADHAEERQPLHSVRGPNAGTAVEVVVPDKIVLNRTRMLRRLDRAMAEIDELASLVQEVPARHPHQGYRGRGAVESPFGDYAGRRRPAIDRDAIRLRAEQVRNEIVRLHRMAERAPGVPVVEPAIVPLAPREMGLFLRSLQSARFSSEKLALVRDLARHSYVTSAQAARIVRALPWWVQLDAAYLLHEATVDPGGYHEVYGVFRADSDRGRLRDRLARRGR